MYKTNRYQILCPRGTETLCAAVNFRQHCSRSNVKTFNCFQGTPQHIFLPSYINFWSL